jgi:putative transposase
VKGRKRHLAVDTQGNVLTVVVHAADIQDRDGAVLVLSDLLDRFPRLRHIWADAGYRGKLVTWVQDTLGWTLEVVKHWWTGRTGFWVGPGRPEPPPIPSGFVPLPHRWIVERTFAWLITNRRLVVEYDELPSSSEARVYLAMSRLMITRLARSAP